MAQVEKAVYTTSSDYGSRPGSIYDPVVVKSNSSATWLAGLLLALVVCVVGGLMVLINSSNNENALDMQKMQEDQANIQSREANLQAQEAKPAQVNADRRQ